MSKHEPWTAAYSVCSLNISQCLIKPSPEWKTYSVRHSYFRSNGKCWKQVDENRRGKATVTCSYSLRSLKPLSFATVRAGSLPLDDTLMCLGLMRSLPSTSRWGHCSICLSVSPCYVLTYSGDAQLSGGVGCLWPCRRWKTATSTATVLSKPPRVKTLICVAWRKGLYGEEANWDYFYYYYY